MTTAGLRSRETSPAPQVSEDDSGRPGYRRAGTTSGSGSSGSASAPVELLAPYQRHLPLRSVSKLPTLERRHPLGRRRESEHRVTQGKTRARADLEFLDFARPRVVHEQVLAIRTSNRHVRVGGTRRGCKRNKHGKTAPWANTVGRDGPTVGIRREGEMSVIGRRHPAR